LALYSSEDPGFGPLEEAEPEEGVFPLEEGTEVSVEIIAIDAGASLFIGNATLDAAGESAVLGTALEALHVHGEWRLLLPGGQAPAEGYALELRLTTISPLYTASEGLALTLTVAEAEPSEAP
jgi:hypothetical protein